MAKIIYFDSYNDKDGNEFIIVFLDDGSAQQLALPPPAVVTNVAPAGTFSATPQSFPNMVSVGLSGEVVVAIIDRLGYFIWDGTNLFQQGTASPVADVIDGGNDYSSVPTVAAFGGHGSGVTLTAEIALGSVSQVKVTNPGSGYLARD